MNIFRLCGDMSHVFSIIVLLLRLRVAKNAQGRISLVNSTVRIMMRRNSNTYSLSEGISVRTHELFLLVFVTRYLDLFTTFYSIYNSVMKVLYIASTASIIYTIRFQEPIKSTYDKAQDTFLHWRFAVAPCAVVALITHMIGSGAKGFDVLELLWTFSIYLEAISILPQLIVLQRYGEVENLTGNYVFFMGAYRFLYILNWIYRAHTEKGYQHHWIVYLCGVLQTMLYADFFYYYFKR